ncbi:hypothetical protein HKD37_07G019649 [Glycine soja]
MHVIHCTICGETHEIGQCIPIEENTQEVHYMGNKQRQGYTQGGFSSFQQGPYNQQGQWRSHPGDQFNKDQGGSSNRPIQQGPNIFQRTTKLEETLTHFMQVGQLAKQIADKTSNSFVANTEKNPKEECKAVMTRSKRFVEAEDEDSVVSKKKASEKKDKVIGESNQEKEKQIMAKKKEDGHKAQKCGEEMLFSEPNLDIWGKTSLGVKTSVSGRTPILLHKARVTMMI